jgi:hypothetical protein
VIETRELGSTGVRMHAPRLDLAILLMFLAACAADEPSEPAAGDFRCVGCKWGPPLLNSHAVNGVEVSALDTTGEFYDGWRLVDVYVVGDAKETANHRVHDVHAVDGVLYGTDDWGTEFSGADFIRSLWTVEIEETGTKEVMEVIQFLPDPSAARYTFIATATSQGVSDTKVYTCPKDDDTGEFAVVIFGDLDVDPEKGTHFERPKTMYFGCAAAAVGKSAVWGYSPWATDDETHQTASRAVRADYCGDGVTYTQSGTALQLSDVFGINSFSNPNADTEAMWGPGGAICIKVPRLVDVSDVACAGSSVKFCAGDDSFEDHKDALLWSKVLP